MQEKSKFNRYIPMFLGSILCTVYWLYINLSGFASTAKFNMAISVVILLCFLLSHVVMNFLTLKKNIRSKIEITWFINFLQWMIPVLFMIIFGSLTLNDKNAQFSVVYIAVGLLSFVLGLVLPKIPFNQYGVGIKFPWILHDKEAWDVTHRVSSIFWVIGGIISIAFAFFPKTLQFFLIYFVLFFGCFFICPLVISVRAHRISKQKH